MSEPLYIKEQRLVDRAFERINTIGSFDSDTRCVIFEKYIKPNVKYSEEREYIDFILGIDTVQGHSSVLIEWCDKSGYLHSFNGFPSRITYGTYNWLEVEWHNNGIPFRKNNMFNKISVYEKSDYSSSMGNSKILDVSLEWLNKDGRLHSFNDMPSKITNDRIEWHFNGANYRRSKYSELPCVIHSTGQMKFCERKDGVPETVNFPLSTRYYGKETLYNLNQYEKFVKWPIRKLLTL